MKPNCVEAVRAAAAELGREGITDAQIAAIESRVQRTMRELARTEEGWQGMSPDQRLAMAAERAMQDVQAEAARKVANAELQVVKTAAVEARIGKLLELHPGDKRAQALVHHLDETGLYIEGVKREAMGQLMTLMDAVKSGEGATAGRRLAMFLFDADNPKMTADLATEIFRNADGSSGNALAQKGAKAWLDTVEKLRQRFNSAGGDVGRLEYGYLPQPHDAARVRAAGRDTWVAEMLPLVDRSRYVDEAGARLPDAEVTRILGGIWETIATEGMNKSEPGAGPAPGTSARANRGSEHRELHFKDASGYLAYLQHYGSGSMYDAMTSHVGRVARDIGLVERYGPNPNAQMRLQFDLAARADGTKVDALDRTFGLRPQSYWDQLNGTASSPASARIAQVGTDVRNIQTFGKLAGAVISSITDMGTFVMTTGYNRLGYWNSIENIGRSASSKEARQFMTAHGIIAESMVGDINRWTGDNIRQTWSGRLANSTLKLSLMNAWTDTLRRAFSLTMMQGLARMSKTEWGKLTEWDRTRMERAGITEADWQVITRAELTKFNGVDHLTPEAIRNARTGAASAEPPVAAGMTRLYHGSAEHGRYDGNAWFSSQRDYAANYREGGELQYVDYPTDKLNAIIDPDGYGQTIDKGFTVNLELDSSQTGLRKPAVGQAAPIDQARANEVVSKVLGLITDESEFAVLNPDLATKTLASAGGTQRGTVRGELARSVMQFKSFPIAMVSRHWKRMLDAPRVSDGSTPMLANRLMYAGALMVTTTALGAIALQAKQMVSGKDPIDMTGDHAAKFWAKAVAQGGGLSIVGDMVLNDPGNSVSDVVRGMAGTALGPAIGTGMQAAGIGIENAWKAAKGKETHTAAETINLLRQNTPYVNLWYAKAALDHAGMHALQENLSPGYLGKMQQRAAKEWGQSYWWSPTDTAPKRAPDFGKAVGQ